MQAIMLAAGMGKRLAKYTKNNTKCMLEVGNKTLIERAIEALLEAGIKKFTIVVGYKGENLKKFLTEECKNPKVKEMDIKFIDNPIYDTTNNIYSLFLASEEMQKDDTIILESDLIYDYELIKRLVSSSEKNLVAVAKYEQWMDGTVIRIDNNQNVLEFIEKKNFSFDQITEYYKTVNVYKFSKEFIQKAFLPFLDAYIKAYGENEYYELVLKIIAHISKSQLKALDVSNIKWYEIDDAQDLGIATSMFSTNYEKLNSLQARYGGYWRFNKLLDYCYLVNPYFPPKAMIKKFNSFAEQLITQYPSGQKIQCINASRLFNSVDENHICVGNGAAELINALGLILKGKMYVPKSAFHEYIRCFKNCEFSIFDMKSNGYKYDINEIKKNIDKNDIICIVNPDNPTGAFIEYKDIIQIIEECEKKNKIIIFDESFIDFADKDIRYTLLSNDILNRYKNLIVIKSISKSYGVPGIRLGVLATSNENIIMKLKSTISIWNLNSYAEYFLQIINLYKKEYVEACDKISIERKRFLEELKQIPELEVYDSQANYVLCDLGKTNSTDVASQLLEENIFIKDLRTKEAFNNMNYIRLAIRTEKENRILSKKLKEILEK